MSNRIGNRGPVGPNEQARRSTGSEQSRQTTSKPLPIADALAGEDKSGVEKDSFHRGQAAQKGGMAQQLAAFQQAQGTGRTRFSNQDLEYLFSTFAALIGKNKGLTRRERAELFVQTVLNAKGKSRLKQLVKDMPKAAREQMCEALGDSLEGSPVFASLLDTVSDEANKQDG